MKTELGKAGRELLAWLETNFDISTTELLVMELCRVADRLSQVRRRLDHSPIQPRGRKNPLLDVEIKLSGQFSKLWKTAGLADPDLPAQRTPPMGRGRAS